MPESLADKAVAMSGVRIAVVVVAGLLVAVGLFALVRSASGSVTFEDSGTSVVFNCGSALAPKHYSESEASSVLGGEPFLLSAGEVLNSQCNSTGRRIRGSLLIVSGAILIAASVWARRRGVWAALLVLSGALALAGLPNLFATST